jgi:hypothetical protein
MELNRNHYFMIGLILVFLGLQFRYVDTYTLNEETSQFIATRLKKEKSTTQAAFNSLLSVATPSASRQEIKPPRWLGFSLLSIGAVLILHSLAMKKPGG